MDSPIEKLGAPASEFNEDFVQKMRARMAVSYHKYGLMADTLGVVDHLASIEKRLAKYRETGNTEWLIDAANEAMIEYSFPNHSEAHFRATDSDESPGRAIPHSISGKVVHRADHNLDLA